LTTAEQSFHNGQFFEAQSNFAALASDPGANQADQQQGLFWQGRSQMVLGDYPAAVETFDAFIQKYADSALAPAAAFQKALALEQLGLYSEAVAAYQASLYAGNPIAAYVYERLGDLALTYEAYEAAQEWYLAGLNVTADPGFQVHLREGVAEANLGLEQYDQASPNIVPFLISPKLPTIGRKSPA
jgi:tetratricopeptide (TPR) repeat protein